MARLLRVLPAVPTIVLAGLLAACGSATTSSSSPPPPSPSATSATSLGDLQDKVGSIAADSCTTRPAAQAYPDCARYVAEVGNAALAAQGAAATVGAENLHTTANRLADEVAQFSRMGCVAAPGVASPPAQACGDVFQKIQTDLTAMRTQLAAAARTTTAPPS